MNDFGFQRCIHGFDFFENAILQTSDAAVTNVSDSSVYLLVSPNLEIFKFLIKYMKDGTIKPQELANIKDFDTFVANIPARVLGSL